MQERDEKSTQKLLEKEISFKYYLNSLYNLLAYRITTMNTRITIAIAVSAIIASTAPLVALSMSETALAAGSGGGCGTGGCSTDQVSSGHIGGVARGGGSGVGGGGSGGGFGIGSSNTVQHCGGGGGGGNFHTSCP